MPPSLEKYAVGKNKYKVVSSGRRAASEKALSGLLVASIVLLLFTVSLEGYVYAAISPHTGTIRITPDGIVEGTEKISRNGDIYTLTGDISGTAENGGSFLSIEKNGVTLDGAGHTISGTGTGVAIWAMGKTDITIKNTRIVNFGTGIELRLIDFDSGSIATNNRVLDNYLRKRVLGTRPKYGQRRGFRQYHRLKKRHLRRKLQC